VATAAIVVKARCYLVGARRASCRVGVAQSRIGGRVSVNMSPQLSREESKPPTGSANHMLASSQCFRWPQHQWRKHRVRYLMQKRYGFSWDNRDVTRDIPCVAALTADLSGSRFNGLLNRKNKK